jgi:hypothetical protein
MQKDCSQGRAAPPSQFQEIPQVRDILRKGQILRFERPFGFAPKNLRERAWEALCVQLKPSRLALMVAKRSPSSVA